MMVYGCKELLGNKHEYNLKDKNSSESMVLKEIANDIILFSLKKCHWFTVCLHYMYSVKAVESVIFNLDNHPLHFRCKLCMRYLNTNLGVDNHGSYFGFSCVDIARTKMWIILANVLLSVLFIASISTYLKQYRNRNVHKQTKNIACNVREWSDPRRERKRSYETKGVLEESVV